MIVAKINPDGSVVETHPPKAVWSGVVGSKYLFPRNIFKLWPDADLNAIGYARVKEDRVPTGKVSTGHADSFANGQITRTHTLIDYVDPVPGDADYDYAALRQRDYSSHNDMIVALWERVIEGRPLDSDAIEVERQKVKTRFPK